MNLNDLLPGKGIDRRQVLVFRHVSLLDGLIDETGEDEVTSAGTPDGNCWRNDWKV